jgi:transposase
MDVSPFLPLPAGLVIEQIQEATTSLTVLVQATAPTAACPLCQKPSEHIHSHYLRMVADLAACGRQVTLQLSVRKFFLSQLGLLAGDLHRAAP